MARAGADRANTAMLGDKLLTDMLAAQPGRRSGPDGGAGRRRGDGVAEGPPRYAGAFQGGLPPKNGKKPLKNSSNCLKNTCNNGQHTVKYQR